MEILTTLAAWRAYANHERHHGRRVGLVPTMGALHDGHSSLMDAARRECDVVIATIFVNPRQFNDAADLARYPRSRSADIRRCERAEVDVVVEPSLPEMWPAYPRETATTVAVRGVADDFEGADRPGHFDGVASVVTKLLNVTGPCRAYFGEKDYQQLAVINQVVRDLALPVSVRSCPIVRDDDGLALSSRNVQLTSESRLRALALSRALAVANDGTARTASEVRSALTRVLGEHDVSPAYAEVVHPETLRPLHDLDHGPGRVLLAAVVDGVRLLDNGPVTLSRVLEDSHASSH